MFVSDSSLFPSSKIKLRICGMNGIDFISSYHQDSTVDNLKVAALSQCFGPSDSMKDAIYHKIVLVRTGRTLEDDKTLQQQGVIENDELLLLKRRLCPSNFDMSTSSRIKSEEAKRGPSSEVIDRVTGNLSKPKDKPLTANITGGLDFQTELRRILISLIEVSQKLLCLNPEASKIFHQAEEILTEPTTKNNNEEVDANDLKQLMDMGFTENRARKALLLNRSTVLSAMEWLLNHENDVDIDEPIQLVEDLHVSPVTEVEGATGGSSTQEDTSTTNHKKVSNILHSLRAYRKREFKPDAKAMKHLLEMGFEEKDVIAALRVTRNDGNAACEWLLSDKKVPCEETDEGFETDSPLLKAILANPTVQLGLNNPRCLIAFIQMLEQPLSASHWLSDAETGPVLVQVSRIYHAEKNSEHLAKSNGKTEKCKKSSSR